VPAGDVAGRSVSHRPVIVAAAALADFVDEPAGAHSYSSEFLRNSIQRGLATVTRGKVFEVCCPKAIFFGMEAIRQEIASVMIQISLSEASPKMSELGTGAIQLPLSGVAGVQPIKWRGDVPKKGRDISRPSMLSQPVY
jgi:hypothetical protein